MELPSYHLPTFKNVMKSMWERGSGFLKKAGSIILLASVAIWFLSNFGFENSKFLMVDDMNNSILAVIGKALAVLFEPLGFGFWQASVATIMGLLAKEGIVSVLGVLVSDISQLFTQVSGFSFLVFNLLCIPCVAAVAAIWRELRNWKWFVFALLYQTFFAYSVAFCIYQFALLFTTGVFTVSTIVAFVTVGLYLFFIFRKPSKRKSDVK